MKWVNLLLPRISTLMRIDILRNGVFWEVGILKVGIMGVDIMELIFLRSKVVLI